MPATDLEFCNLCIGRIGGDRIADFDEGSPLAIFCAEQWPEKRRMLLGKYRWNFANTVRLLAPAEIGENETAVMPYKFTIPADMIDAVHAFRDHPDPYEAERTPYVMLANDHFWADEAIVYGEYTGDRAVALWPGYFSELAQVAFTADLAGHAQLTTLQRTLEAKAWGTPQENGEGGLYLTARNEDARMAPPRKLVSGVDAGPLIGARYTGASTFIERLGIR